MKWKRKEPEVKKGDYWFAGRCVATAGVANEIPMEEVKAIAQDVHNTAFTLGGIDYLGPPQKRDHFSQSVDNH